MRIDARRIAAGLLTAGLWGVLVEAAAWALLGVRLDAGETRVARLGRAAETGAFTGIVALAASLGCLALPALRRRLAAAPVWIPGCFGLAAASWLAVGFLGPQPALAGIRLSQDALTLRALPLAAASVVALGIVLAGLRVTPPGWVHALQGGLCGLAVAGMLLPGGGPGRAGRPDVFLISVDTLRADHLGCYGYPLPTSPAIDAFCAEGVVYDAAMAAASATIPSYTSLMSGTLPDAHGVYTNFDKVDPSVVTLAERLSGAGYHTAALLEGSFPGSFANIGQGFELLIQRGVTASAPLYTPSEGLRSLLRGLASFAGERLNADVSVTTRVAERWLRSLRADVPVFAHVYWPYPHDPYTPPRRYLSEVPERAELPEAIRDAVHRYDAEIRYTDAQVGRVLAALREVGRYDAAWIVFVADHGEELGRVVDDPELPKGPFFGHSRYLFDSSVRVPLVVKPPATGSRGPRREAAVVSTASLASTLLLALGVPGSESLVAPLPGLVTAGAAPSEALSVARNPSRSFDRASVRRGPWRLIETRRPTPGVALLRYQDGRESADQSAAAPDETRELLTLLHTLHPPDAGASRKPAAELSERERRMLEELGYAE